MIESPHWPKIKRIIKLREMPRLNIKEKKGNPRMKIFVFTLLSLTPFCYNANLQAQENLSTNESIHEFNSENSNFQPKWNMSLDATNLLLKGAGAETHYRLSERVSLGAYAKGFKLLSDDYEKSTLATKHEAQEYGAKLSYYPLGFQSEGWVMALAVGQIKVKSTGKANFEKYDMSDLNWEESVTKTKNETQGFLGYQFIGQRFSERTRFVFRAGLGYGTGGRLKVNYGGTHSEIENGVLIDLNGGVQF
jgi:hypothetical protein